MSMLGMAGKTATRWTIWGRVLIAAEVALMLKRHLDLLDSGEKAELRGLVAKSKGKPTNLTARERKRLQALVTKLEPHQFAKQSAVAAMPWRRKG